ncbi:MAG: hypothetical protein WC100_05890 [Sterolibacterium sp.]
MKPVTDPATLAELNGGLKPVKDPNILAQLEGGEVTGSFGQNFAAGAGKIFTDMARGAKQILDVPAQALERAFGEVKVGGMPTAKESAMQTQAEIVDSRRRDAPLMKTGGGVLGTVAGSLPVAMVPGANTYTGAALTGAALGALQPTLENESRLLNAGIGAGAGVAGKYVGGKVADAVTGKMTATKAAAASEALKNAPRDATLAASREAGYVVPPTQVNPSSAWNQLLEGFSGKIKTGQAASVKNQSVTNRLAREAVGLSDDAPLTSEALKGLRSTAGTAYEDIASAGQFATDKTFRQQITKLSDAQRTLAKEIPELANSEVLTLAKSLDKPSFDGRTLIEASKALREKATAAFRAGEGDAGKFYRGAADNVEDLVERGLMDAGRDGAGMLNAFREARKLIAKTHTIEGALNDATGNINAAKLAAQLTKGKPLSGGLETAAKFAGAFPKAAQEVERTGAALATSPLDWAAMGTLSAVTSNPLMMAGVAARPAARSLILSKPYQALMTNPTNGPGAALRASQALANPVFQRLLPSGAVAGSLAYRGEK